jgi:hypothetical protein
MRYPFKPDQFIDYSVYESHLINLDRAQQLAHKICGIWGDELGLAEPNTPWQQHLFELIDMATQLGYEQAIGKSHQSSDYGITNDFVENLPNKCEFCESRYMVYGCEERCALEANDEECRLHVKSTLE